MSAKSARSALALIALFFLAPPLCADTYWQHDPATPASWFDPTNWTSGLPNSSTAAFVCKGTALIDANGMAANYLIFSGSSSTNPGGKVQQLAGTTANITYDFSMSDSSGYVSVYDFLNATKLSIGQDLNLYGAGSQTFSQSGGLVSVAKRIHLYSATGGTSTYNLKDGGQLTCESLIVGDYSNLGHFNQQSGTTATARYVTIGSAGNYVASGGTLNVDRGFVNAGTLNLGGQPFSLAAPSSGIVDWSGTLAGTGQVSFTGGASSLLIYTAGAPPATVSTTGFTMQRGSTLTIPSGRSLIGWGIIPGHVNVQGTINTGGNGLIDIVGGISLSSGANVILREVGSGGLLPPTSATGLLDVEDTTSSMTGGNLQVAAMYVGSTGTAEFDQSGGTISPVWDVTQNRNYTTSLTLGKNTGSDGTYKLSGTAVLHLYDLNLSYAGKGRGTFIQTGGTCIVDDCLGVENTTPGASTYELDSGSLQTLNVSINGNGTFTQTGGTHTVTGYNGGWLYLGQGISGSIYNLSGTGQLSVTHAIELTHTGTQFNHSGGTVNTYDIDVASNATYSLSGTGIANATEIGVGHSLNGGGSGLFDQSGGTNNVSGLITLGSSSHPDDHGTYRQSGGTFKPEGLIIFSGGAYEHTGGVIEISRQITNTGVFDAKGQPCVVSAPSGIVDLTAGTWQGLGAASLSAGSSSLVIYNSANPPSSIFNSFSTAGFSLQKNSSVTIPSGNSVLGWGIVPGHVNCAGTLDGSDGSIFINGGVSVSGTVKLGSGNLTVIDSSSGISAGSITATQLYIGDVSNYGKFTQSGGTVTAGYTAISYQGDNADYYMSGGTLNTTDINNAENIRGNFYQTGGTHNAPYGMYLSRDPYGAPTGGHYELGGTGTINAGSETIGNGASFVQTGGTNKLTVGALNIQGNYDLSGGVINAKSATIGGSGVAFFEQSGGTFTATSGLGVSSQATLNLHSGTISASSEGITGVVNHSNGANTVTNDLTVNANAAYNLSGGNLNAKNIYLSGSSVASPGRFIHTGGIVTLTSNLYVGYASGCYGYYELDSSATLNANNLYVGGSGYGTFVNNGGTKHLTGNMYIGKNGTYTQGSGAITGATLSIGSNGDSTFNLTGGTGDFTTLNVGCNSTGTGHVNLSGFGMISADIATIGAGGPGFLNQNCGMLTIRNNLVIGGTSGGQLIAGTALIHSGIVVIGQVNQGLFSTDAGELQATVLSMGEQPGSLGIMNITDTWMRAGTFLVGGNGQAAVNIMSSSTNMEVSSKLAFGSQSTFTAVPGSSIHMTGAAFENKNTDPTKLAGLANTTLLYDGHTGATDPFELAGKDFGRDLDGLVSNFALGGMTLEDKAIVQLVDNFDNAHRNGLGGSAEALYMESLTMLPGSTLDLNGKHLYVCDLNFQGGTIITGTGGALISLCPGDADNNWKIDGADLALWQQNYDPSGAHSATNTFALADWNNDGKIDGADLALWQQNYNPSGGLPQQTPEPGTILLLGTGALGLAGFLRRRFMS